MNIYTLRSRQSSTVMLLLFFLLAGTLSASAEEYKSMIRYDRVWECLNLEGNGPNKAEHIKCMRFDGTEEINGKTYHRLVTFQRTISTNDGYNIQKVYEHEGYLREENGIVYTLVEEPEDLGPIKIGEWFGGRYIPKTNTPIPETNVVKEYILYNFNIPADEYYDGLTYVCESAIVAHFKVISENYSEIDGELCKSIEVSSIDPDYGYSRGTHTYIEGIGAGENGCLSHHEYDAHISGMWTHNYINRVFDLNGKVIFKTLGVCQYEDLHYGPFSATDGIGSITEQPESDAPYYDILGRRIVAPAPGQLYIQGGRKHIAK